MALTDLLSAAQASKSGGMSSFYKTYLDTTSKAHDLAVAASLSKKPSTFGPARPTEKEQTEAELAAEILEKTGRKVELNDDGIIIDKRETMVGGLNIIAKKKVSGELAGGFAAPIASRKLTTGSSQGSQSTVPTMSAAERGKQSRERHSREVERQMVELDLKRKREEEEALDSKVQKVVKRNDASKVDELKRKAEERRIKRESDAKEAAAIS